MGFLKDNTHNNTFQNLDGITRLILLAINEDQKIKRLLTYQTYEPLKEYSTTYDGKVLYQPDIKGSLLGYQKICVVKNGGKSESDFININPILYPYPFQTEKFLLNYPTLYCHYSGTNLYESMPCEHLYYLNLLVPMSCMELKPYGDNRGNVILDALTNLIDGATLDEESKARYGDLKFRFYGQIASQRITKTNDIMIWTIPIRVSGLHVRGDKTNSIVRI